MTNERKRLMSDTRDRLQKEYKLLRTESCLNNDMAGRIFFLMDKRFNTPGVRSFFVNTIYKYIIEQARLEKLPLVPLESNIFDTKLPLVAESIITIQYYHNQILDGKGGVYNPIEKCDKNKIDRNLIAGNYAKDFLYNYIDGSIFPEDLVKARITTKAVRRIFQYVDLGQDIQDHWGTSEAYSQNLKQYVSVNPEIDNFINKNLISEFWKAIHKQGVSDKKEWFVRNYLLRINLTSASLFAILAELVMDLLGYNGKERNNVIKLSSYIGFIGQIVNDNNDYVLPEAKIHTISKIPEDSFADLRNDNITLPIIFYLQQDKVNINDIKNIQELFRITDFSLGGVDINGLGFNRKFKWVVRHVFQSFKSISCLKPVCVGYNKENFAMLQRDLFPALKKSIQLTQIIKTKIENTTIKLVNSHNPIASLLLDMNSIADFDYNRYYQNIYASVEEKELMIQILKQPIFVFLGLNANINIATYLGGIGRRVFNILLDIGKSVEKIIEQMDNWCRKSLPIRNRVPI